MELYHAYLTKIDNTTHVLLLKIKDRKQRISIIDEQQLFDKHIQFWINQDKHAMITLQSYLEDENLVFESFFSYYLIAKERKEKTNEVHN